MKSLTWSRWIALDADLATYKLHVPAAAGFYRICEKYQSSLIYIGQTGRSLRMRTRGELARNVMRPLGSPPWNDPHTAAPMLRAYRHENEIEFEVSVATCDLSTRLRQCYEDALLYLHRQTHGHSTLCNHGRKHPLWSHASNRKNSRPTARLEVAVEYIRTESHGRTAYQTSSPASQSLPRCGSSRQVVNNDSSVITPKQEFAELPRFGDSTHALER